MSRVSYVMMNPGGDRELTEAVRLALDELVGELLDARRSHARDRVLEVVLVGNPIMHHIVLGIDPTPLGAGAVHARHQPSRRHAGERPRPGAPQRPRLRRTVHRRPRRRRHRGRDPAGGTAPSRAHAAARRRRHQRRDRARRPPAAVRGVEPDRPGIRGRADLLGSARHGRRDRARAHRSRPRSSRGSRSSASTCGRTIPRSPPKVAKTGVTGICGSGIIEVIAEMYLAGCDRPRRRRARRPRRPLAADRRRRPHVLVRAVGRRRRSGARIAITQNDVRAIQLAKAALRAGIELLDRPRRSADRRRHPPRRRVRRPHRPAARDGARAGPRLPARRRALGRQRRRHRRRAGAAVARGCGTRWSGRSRNVTKIETATEPRFQELFVAAMAFPHATAPTDHTSSSSVTLPGTDRGIRERLTQRARRRQTQTGDAGDDATTPRTDDGRAAARARQAMRACAATASSPRRSSRAR